MTTQTVSEHTPTPWSAASNWIMRRHPTCDVQIAICAAYTAPKAISDPRDRANARFIVEAVNAHDKLMRVLRLTEYITKQQNEGLEITAIDWNDLREAVFEASKSIPETGGVG